MTLGTPVIRAAKLARANQDQQGFGAQTLVLCIGGRRDMATDAAREPALRSEVSR
jgi:hypothetical protein